MKFDRKLVIGLGSIALLAVLALVVWMVAPGGSEAASESASPEAAHASSASSTATEPEFPEELPRTARSGAVAAGRFDTRESDAVRREKLISAGFSPEYADSYRPVFIDVFGAEPEASVESRSLDFPVFDKSEGEVGRRKITFRVSMNGTSLRANSGSPMFGNYHRIEVKVAVDEATGKVVGVDMPSPEWFKSQFRIK